VDGEAGTAIFSPDVHLPKVQGAASWMRASVPPLSLAPVLTHENAVLKRLKFAPEERGLRRRKEICWKGRQTWI